MTAPKPSFDDYPRWHEETLGEPINDDTKRRFEGNQVLALDSARDHPFVATLDRTLKVIADEYKTETGVNLFSGDDVPELIIHKKSFESALNKSYRQNIIKNNAFPEMPEGGWLTPDKWFATLNDLIRGSLTCRYLDGPGFVARKLHEAAKNEGHFSKFDSVQLDRGYYAYHFYLGIPTFVLYEKVEQTQVLLEIQFTTHLQEIVLDLTHRFYEALRVEETAVQRDDSWKWDYRSARFKAGYLSHTLHLLEGLIAELRERAIQHPQHNSSEGPREAVPRESLAAMPETVTTGATTTLERLP